MTTVSDIVIGASKLTGVSIACNDQEMLQMLNRALAEMERDFEDVSGINELITGEE
jgi:hypothetical protein